MVATCDGWRQWLCERGKRRTMDGHRFDEMSRSLATGATRREVVRLLAGGFAGGILGVLGIRSGEAAPRRTTYVRKPCPNANEIACAGGGRPVCVDPQTDSNNCGGCGVVCAGGTACVNGTCAATCPVGQVSCSSAPGGCIDPSMFQTDPNNCGGCGQLCQSVIGGVTGPGACCGSVCFETGTCA